MKYSVDLNIYTSTQAVRDSVQALLPLENDSRVDATSGYEINTNYRAEADALSPAGYSLNSEIKCNTEADQLSIIDDILAEVGMLDDCEVGSKVQAHDCSHDGTGGNCVVQTKWEVV